MWRIRRLIEKLRLGITFFIRGFRSNSWEVSEVYMDIATRLELCLKTFEEDELYCWCDGDTPSIRRLKECIILCRRLHSFDYSKHHIKLMHKYSTNRTDVFGGSDLFPDTKVIDRKLYSVMTRAACKKDRLDYDAARDRLAKLLSVGLEQWAT